MRLVVGIPFGVNQAAGYKHGRLPGRGDGHMVTSLRPIPPGPPCEGRLGFKRNKLRRRRCRLCSRPSPHSGWVPSGAAAVVALLRLQAQAFTPSLLVLNDQQSSVHAPAYAYSEDLSYGSGLLSLILPSQDPATRLLLALGCLVLSSIGCYALMRFRILRMLGPCTSDFSVNPWTYVCLRCFFGWRATTTFQAVHKEDARGQDTPSKQISRICCVQRPMGQR